MNKATVRTQALDLRLSSAARRELTQREEPLCVYLELLFSCMIRKQVHFPKSAHQDALLLDSPDAGLWVWFRAVGTKSCSVSEQPAPDLQTFPVQRVEPFLPRWLTLDFRRGVWSGQFGYAEP